MNNRRLLIGFLFLVLTLLLRDAPYINVFIIDKLWLVYVLLILGVAFFFIPRKAGYSKGTLFSLPIIALAFTLVKVAIAAEVIGIILYLILWIVVLFKVISFVREKDDSDK